MPEVVIAATKEEPTTLADPKGLLADRLVFVSVLGKSSFCSRHL